MHFQTLIKIFESIIHIIKKVQSSVSLKTSILLKNLIIWGGNCIYWACEWNLRSRENNDSKLVFIGPSKGALSFPKHSYTPLGLKLLFLIAKISNVFIEPSKFTQCYLKLKCTSLGLKLLLSIHFRNTTNQSFLHNYKAFVDLTSVISFWPNLLSFILPQIKLPKFI